VKPMSSTRAVLPGSRDGCGGGDARGGELSSRDDQGN